MIGKIIKLMRTNRNMKQSELAKKLNVAESTISMYETESRQATLEIIKEIAKVCDFEIQFLDKRNNKIYRFNDVKRLDTDTRVRKK